MKSSTTGRFWKCHALLPKSIKGQAKKAFKIFLDDAYHPSLHFRKVHSTLPIFSVRITKDYRAVGVIERDEVIWFWIGSHAGYTKLVKKLRRKK